jgi:hypothetical protein
MNWLQAFWPILQDWGATSVKLWNRHENGRQILFCCYTVKNLNRWNKEAMNSKIGILVRTLNDIVEMDRMSIKITRSIPDYYN